MLKGLKQRGDKAVVHGLRGLPSNGKIGEAARTEALQILSQEVYRGFGPTLAAEYLSDRHDIDVSRETLRKWMVESKLWRARKRSVEKVHSWRPRRSRYGELVQWDTSKHDWLEGRGEDLLLIQMIDDATSQRFARFVRSDSTLENMNVFGQYLQRFGRPLACYTTRQVCFKRQGKANATNLESIKILDNMRRRRSNAHSRSWKLSGFQRIVHRRKGGLKEALVWPRIDLSKECGWPA